MKYSTDRPINSGEQDLLGRLSFSNQLGKAIYEFDGNDGLVIGLFGKWGTGKTSVINLAINETNRLAEKDENKPIIMRFIPWSYSENDNLISMFFQCLKNKISNISFKVVLNRQKGAKKFAFVPPKAPDENKNLFQVNRFFLFII